MRDLLPKPLDIHRICFFWNFFHSFLDSSFLLLKTNGNALSDQAFTFFSAVDNQNGFIVNNLSLMRQG